MTSPVVSVQPKRWWQSRIFRGVIVLVTSAGIWLAVVISNARKQERAIRLVQELGGNLLFDNQIDAQGRFLRNATPLSHEWLPQLLGKEYFRKVFAVDLAASGGAQASDDNLAFLELLDDVRIIEMGNSLAYTDDGLKHLAGLAKLHTLDLRGCSIRGSGLRHLPSGLEYLDLQFNPLEDEALIRLGSMPKLRVLLISNTPITDRALAGISQIQSLEVLHLQNTDITNAGLAHLRSLAGLTQLRLHGTNVTETGIAELERALPTCQVSPSAQYRYIMPEDFVLWPESYQPNKQEVLAKFNVLGGGGLPDAGDAGQPIVTVSLADSKVSDEILLNLLVQMPGLKVMNLRHVSVGDRLASGLSRVSQLEYLFMDQCHLTDAGLVQLGKLTALRKLSLTGNRISDAGLDQLTGLKNLEVLHVGDTRVTESGRQRLRQALPKCLID